MCLALLGPQGTWVWEKTGGKAWAQLCTADFVPQLWRGFLGWQLWLLSVEAGVKSA